MKNDEQLCSICFCPFEEDEAKYPCANPSCNDITCQVCTEALITHSEKINLIPSCSNTNCRGYYILSSIGSLPKEIISQYESACMNFFLKGHGDNVKKDIEQKNIVNAIRDERLKFLEQTFPKGIALVAKLTFKDKMKQLDKQRTLIIKMKLKNAERTCLNLTCNGFLNPDFNCMSCKSVFCTKCEIKITGPNHQCKQQDLDSINLVNSMIKCPGCKLPVFKNQGCDSITCSNCNTHFEYSSGKIGGHGSHNEKINVKLFEKKKLSDEYGKYISPESLLLLLQIEAIEPVFKSKDTLLTPIKSYILTGQTNNNKKKYSKDLAKKIDAYTKFNYKNTYYHKCLIEITDMFNEKPANDIMENKLTEIFDRIKQYQSKCV